MALSRWDPFFSFPAAFTMADRRFFNRARRIAAMQDPSTGVLPLDAVPGVELHGYGTRRLSAAFAGAADRNELADLINRIPAESQAAKAA